MLTFDSVSKKGYICQKESRLYSLDLTLVQCKSDIANYIPQSFI